MWAFWREPTKIVHAGGELGRVEDVCDNKWWTHGDFMIKYGLWCITVGGGVGAAGIRLFTTTTDSLDNSPEAFDNSPEAWMWEINQYLFWRLSWIAELPVNLSRGFGLWVTQVPLLMQKRASTTTTPPIWNAHLIILVCVWEQGTSWNPVAAKDAT